MTRLDRSAASRIEHKNEIESAAPTYEMRSSHAVLMNHLPPPASSFDSPAKLFAILSEAGFSLCPGAVSGSAAVGERALPGCTKRLKHENLLESHRCHGWTGRGRE
jgi:hypothetical protein